VSVAEHSASIVGEKAWEIDTRHPGPLASIAEIWRNRRLLRFIGSRALRKIYRRTILGWAWLFIIPLFPIALRTLVFGGLLGVDGDGVPYLLFLTAGTVVWDLFAMSLTWGTRGLEMNRGVADQVYVPGAVLTVGNLTPALLDFVLKLGAFLLMALAFWIFQGSAPIALTHLPWTAAALGLAFLLAVALSFFTSVWAETGRDTRFVLGQVLAVWYLVTPILYPASAVPASWQRWIALNPMAPIVETFKWSVFGVGQHDLRALSTSAVAIAALLVLGLMYFARSEAAAHDER
jgi:lipopolysaccharide transport system permease protein